MRHLKTLATTAMQTRPDATSLLKFLDSAKKIVVFTGAGISTESGISDYRSKGGLWDRFRPVTLEEFLDREEMRCQYWETKKELYAALEAAKPNLGHLAIARLDRTEKLLGVITQNIDGLHQMAGLDPKKVLELHGTSRETVCLGCGLKTSWRVTYRRLVMGEKSLCCLECGGLLKPNTISFGQNLDPEVLSQAFEWAGHCDLLLAVGSTLIVEPAASLPVSAKRQGARLVIINLSETPVDETADLVIRGKAGIILDEAIRPLL